MTMERARGRPFAGMQGLPQPRRDEIGEILFRFYYGALHRYGFSSADPHPGNYLLMDDGRMAFFDFGLVCNLDSRMRPHMLAAFLALRDGDPAAVFEHARSMRYVTRPEEIDPQRFFEWVAFALAPIRTDEAYTFTREFIGERTAATLDPRSPWWSFLRQCNLPRWAVLLYRLELGLFAVLAQLEATANWHSITKEFYDAGEPSTDLGWAEWEWLQAKRGQKGPNGG